MIYLDLWQYKSYIDWVFKISPFSVLPLPLTFSFFWYDIKNSGMAYEIFKRCYLTVGIVDYSFCFKISVSNVIFWHRWNFLFLSSHSVVSILGPTLLFWSASIILNLNEYLNSVVSHLNHCLILILQMNWTLIIMSKKRDQSWNSHILTICGLMMKGLANGSGRKMTTRFMVANGAES